jgi:hypothetical protein
MFYFYLDSNGNEQVIGVLNDYDLSSMKNVPTGRERTGTIPFMALDLLSTEAVEGKIEHLYQHDAESFIWVLIWVSIQYEDGKLSSHRSPLNEWLTVDAKGCHEKKSSFMRHVLRKNQTFVKPSASHQFSWQVALSCLRVVNTASLDVMADEDAYRDLLLALVPTWLRE